MDWDDQNRNPSINNIDHLVVLRFSRRTNFNNSMVFVRLSSCWQQLVTSCCNTLLQYIGIYRITRLTAWKSIVYSQNPFWKYVCKKTSLIEKLFWWTRHFSFHFDPNSFNLEVTQPVIQEWPWVSEDHRKSETCWSFSLEPWLATVWKQEQQPTANSHIVIYSFMYFQFVQLRDHFKAFFPPVFLESRGEVR